MKDTDLKRTHLALKRELPSGMILLEKVGLFYEAFGEDAIVSSPILGATLTTRGGTPMCGFPCHAIDTYLAKLVRAGKSVAIAELAGDGGRREVTRIITPGVYE